MVRISRERLDIEDGRIDRAYLRDYGETVVGGSDGTNAGAEYTVDLENGNVFNLILNEATCGLTFTNAFPSGSATSFTLLLKQDSAGGRTVTWPSNIVWPGETEPTLTTSPSEFNMFSFITINAGNLWFGVSGGSASPNMPLSLWSWGSGANGILGQNSTNGYSSPTQIGLSTDWLSLSIGTLHGLAIKSNGTLWAWGTGGSGQTGQNNIAHRSSPIQVGTDTDWVSVTGAETHSFAIKTDGTLWAWGNGTSGKTGFNDTTGRSSPAQVGAETDWAHLAGNTVSLALKTDGTLWAWGASSTGVLGLNSTTTHSSPAQVGSDNDWSSISNDGSLSMAIKTNGTLWTWGSQSYGQAGQDNTTTQSSPTQVGSVTNWSSVACATSRSFAIKTDGTLWAWGSHGFTGALGLNDLVHRSSPTQVGTDTDWASVVGGDSHALALKTNGTLWGWGSAGSGTLGNGVASGNFSSPIQIGAATSWTNLQSGGSSGLALRNES